MSLHHGTMLLNVKMDALGKYLNPSKEKLKSKGIDSVISRVINLKEITPDIDHDKFCEAMEKVYSDKKLNKTVVTAQDLENIPNLKKLYDHQKDW